jgi:hypothetical protein
MNYQFDSDIGKDRAGNAIAKHCGHGADGTFN